MKVLKTILEQYRNGERGMPTYDELAAIAGGDHDGHARINGGACRAQADAQPVAELKGGVQNRAARYFVYDGENGYQEYVTDAERANAHASIIRSYFDHDDGWFEGVTDIVSGIVTHVTGKSYSVLNPEHEAICECEACGEYRAAGGSNEFSEICDYKVEPLVAATACVACGGSPTAENNPCAVCGRAATVDEAKADAKELRHALFVARDHMRVMANWVKFSDPAAYSWSCNAITIVNAVLERGESK